MAKLPSDIQAALKSDNDLLMLSNDTIRKQIRTHGDLTSDDFARIGGILDNGAVFKDRLSNKVNIFKDGYLLTTKKTTDNKNMIVTFFKVNEKRMEKRIKKGRVIR